MFRRVKSFLGIEGVKVELEIPDVIPAIYNQVEGRVLLQSMHSQEVDRIEIKLVERYSRGRKTEKMTDEYVLGSILIKQSIKVPANEVIAVPFTLKYERLKSEVDQMEDKIFLKPLAMLAKFANAVSSEYYLIAEANVKRTALNPFAKKEVIFD